MKSTPLDPDSRQAIRELRSLGYTINQIVKATGLDKEGVRRVCRKHIGGSIKIKGNSPVYHRCTRCGGALPCLRCIIKERRLRGLVGKEPEDDEELSLAPEIAEAAEQVRANWTPKERWLREYRLGFHVQALTPVSLGTNRR